MVAGRPQNSFWTSCQFLGPGVVPGFSGFPYFHHFMCQRKFAFFRWFGRLCNWIFHGELLGHDSDSDSCHLLLLMHPRSGFLFVFFLFPAVGFLDLQSLRIVQPLLSAHCQQQRDSHLGFAKPSTSTSTRTTARTTNMLQQSHWDRTTFLVGFANFSFRLAKHSQFVCVGQSFISSAYLLTRSFCLLRHFNQKFAASCVIPASHIQHPQHPPHPRISIIPDPPRSHDSTNINDFSCACADAPLRRCWNIYAACDIVAWH